MIEKMILRAIESLPSGTQIYSSRLIFYLDLF